MESDLSRREFLERTAWAAGLAGTAGLPVSTLLAEAAEASHRGSPLPSPRNVEIDHFVVLMMENRSFDHYFGCTRDLETAVRCLREIRAGTVLINDPLTANDAAPFGGMKQAGFGREPAEHGLEAFQGTKHVHIETKIAPKEWRYPYGGGRPPHGA